MKSRFLIENHNFKEYQEYTNESYEKFAEYITKIYEGEYKPYNKGIAKGEYGIEYDNQRIFIYKELDLSTTLDKDDLICLDNKDEMDVLYEISEKLYNIDTNIMYYVLNENV